MKEERISQRAPLVMVVDDEADCREVLETLLSHAGYSVLTASDGNDALAVLRTGLRPAAIALDLAMPGGDGHAVLQFLRATPALARVPVLVISGRVLGAAIPEGATSVLTKPYEASAVLETLHRWTRGQPPAPPPAAQSG